ncbi:tRNA (cytosine(72)-C(5))-methyltransferase NSUN6-like [Diadema antillarum]|uniref:tRNA (cytosine(72)-C(5))-methyltransferase NSUN6-like n=1 Tax=Diadema antillarum TaxID=105358 RepID=UPI003A88FC1E
MYARVFGHRTMNYRTSFGRKTEFKHDIGNHLRGTLENKPTGSDGVASQDVSVTGSVFNSLLQTLSIPPAFTVLRVNDLHHCREDVQQNLQKCIDKQYEQKICPVPEIIPHPVLPDVLIIPSACRDSSEVAPVDKEVIVDLLCGMAVLRGAEIFAPGVMAAPGVPVVSCMNIVLESV